MADAYQAFVCLEHMRVIVQTCATMQWSGFLPAAVAGPQPRQTGGQIGRWNRDEAQRRLEREQYEALGAFRREREGRG